MTTSKNSHYFSYWSLIKGLLGLIGGASIALLAFRLSGVTYTSLQAACSHIAYAPLLFASAASFVLLGFQALRWFSVIRQVHPVSYTLVYRAMAVGFAFNAFMPARAGDFMRLEYVARGSESARGKIIATGIIDLWSDKLGWIISFLIICLIEKPPTWLLKPMIAMCAAVVVVAVILAWFAKKAPQEAIPTSRLQRFIFSFKQGLGTDWKRQLATQSLIGPLSWLWEAFVISLACHALGFNLTLMQAYAVLTAFNLAMFIPTPGNAGTFEASSTFALIAFGIPKEQAAAFGLLYHLSQLIPGILLGMLCFSIEGTTLLKKETP